MRITTWNVNGLRAAIRKGFADVVDRIAPDVLLLQEIRVQPDQLPDEWAHPPGWHVHWHPAERKGYSGVAIWSRRPLEAISTGVGDPRSRRRRHPDPEGRVLRAVVDGVEFVNVYLPSGSHSEDRQRIKEGWMDVFSPWSGRFLKARRPVVLGGDLNIAHTESDIFYAKGNEKNSGFLPHEREWFGRLLDGGWRDFTRLHYGDRQGPYSWWSNRGQARELDRGWRIDYLLGNRKSEPAFRSAVVDREAAMTVSDHAPVTIELG